MNNLLDIEDNINFFKLDFNEKIFKFLSKIYKTLYFLKFKYKNWIILFILDFFKYEILRLYFLTIYNEPLSVSKYSINAPIKKLENQFRFVRNIMFLEKKLLDGKQY